MAVVETIEDLHRLVEEERRALGVPTASPTKPAPRPPEPRPCAEPSALVSAPRKRAPAGRAASARQRRYRQRQRTGGMCVQVEVSETLVESLCAVGLLDAAMSDSREQVKQAVARVLATLLFDSA